MPTLNRTHQGIVNPLEYGASLNSTTLSATLSAIGSTRAYLMLTAVDRAGTPGAWSLTSNVTIPSNVTLLVGAGAQLNIATGITITCNASVEAGLWQWIALTGTGKIVFSGTAEIHPEWWATGLAAAVASGAGCVTIASALSVSSNITIPGTATLRIAGQGSLSVATGVTVTVAGAVEAPLRQWITLAGTGKVVFQRVAVYPQWWGALGDGVADDTVPVQAAFAQENTEIIVPSGTYMISAILSTRSNQTYFFHPGVIFLATVGGFTGINDPMLSLSGRSNVLIYGYGARFTMRRDSYTSGEGRHAILLDGTTNACIQGLTLTETGGDGVSVTGFIGPSSNIVLRDLIISGASRNGISIINVSDCLVENCVISNTFKGAAGSAPSGPWAGIDIEPDTSTHLIRNIRIKNLFTAGNASSGIQIA